MSTSILLRPSALVPVAMSGAALFTVVLHIALFGSAREADEGAAAHIFQLLIAGQLPIVAFFAFKWLQRAPKQAVVVLSSNWSGEIKDLCSGHPLESVPQVNDTLIGIEQNRLTDRLAPILSIPGRTGERRQGGRRTVSRCAAV